MVNRPTPPRRNLPPAAEAWGRYVERRLEEFDNNTKAVRINVGAAIDGVTSSSNRAASHKREVDGRLEHVDEQLEILDDHLENLDVDLDELYEVTLPDLQRRLDDAFDAIEDIDFDTRTNLLVNGDFETGDLTGWKQYDSSLPTFEVVQSDTAYSGEYVAVVTAEDGLSYTEADVEIPASMGLAYLAEMWIRFSPEATNGLVSLLLMVTTTEGQAPYNIAPQGSGAIFDGEWHRFNGVIALGEKHNLVGQWPGGDILSVQLIVSGQVIGEDATVEIDNVQLYDITDEYNIAAVPAAAATETANTALEAAELAVEKGANFIENGGFEHAAGWSLTTTNRIIETEDARTGERVREFDSRSPTGGYNSITSRDYRFNEGDTYYIEAWVRKNGEDQEGGVYVGANTGTSTLTSIYAAEVPSSELPAYEWARVRGYFTVPEGWEEARIQIGSRGPSYYFDDVFVVDVTEAFKAQQQAEQAMTVAGSKNTVTYSTGTPIEDGTREGDTYRQRDAQGNIIGEWEWDGDNWQRREISSESISNLDVGKLTAGSAAIDDLVAQRIGAATGEFIELATDQLIASEAGFDEAVANQMFVDIFTANQVTADQIDVNSIASHSGFIDELFSHNLSLTGELTALSEDFTTVLSQAGVRMFANNSLVYEGDWEVPGGDAFSYGGWPGRLAISGDRILAVPTGQMHTRYAAFIYDLDGNQQGNPVQPESGWRSFELSANSAPFLALVQQVPDTRVRRIERRSRTGALQASFAQESGQPGTTRTSRLAALEDGTIALARGSEATQESWIDLLDGSDGSHIRRVATFPNTSNWGIQYLAATGDYIFSYISFGWPGAPRYISQHTIAGEHVRDIYIPGWPSSLSASGDTLWVGIQQVGGLILGYDINTGTATFVGRLHDRQDLSGGIQAPNGDIYGIPAFWEGADAVIIRRHSLSPEAHVRVAIDNFEGRLTAQRAEVEQREVRETYAPPNGKTVANNLVSGSFNTFQSLNEADQVLFAPREGTRILVDGVEYIRRSGQWVFAGAQSGWENVPETVSSGAQTAPISVTFPYPYEVPPFVLVSPAGSNRLLFRAYNITNTGFTTRARNVSDGSTGDGSFFWLAIPATSA